MISPLAKLLTFFDLTRNPAPKPVQAKTDTRAAHIALANAYANTHAKLRAETYGEGRA